MAYRAVLARLATLRFTVDCTAVSLGLPIDDAVEAVQQAHLRADPNSATVPVPDMHLLVPDIIEVTEA